jgi:hypothetical protein
LSRFDADFVDAIHSDVFFIGTKEQNGHADFYPNYNMVQPACPPPKLDNFYDYVQLMCSHFNAVRYWVETLRPNQAKLFASQKCENWEDFSRKKCNQNAINFMGIGADRKVQGNFFIKLKSSAYIDGRYFYQWLLKRIDQRINDLLYFEI